MADENRTQAQIMPFYAADCPIYYTNFLGVKTTDFEVIVDVGIVDLRAFTPGDEQTPAVAEAQFIAQLFMHREVARRLARLISERLGDSEQSAADQGE